MVSTRRSVRIAGALFLIAMVSSLVGGGLIGEEPGSAKGLIEMGASGQVAVGIILEMINAAAVVGIAAALYPTLREHSGAMAAAYLGFRILEAVVCVDAAFNSLTLVALGRQVASAGVAGIAQLEPAVALAMAERSQTVGVLVPLFVALSAPFLYITMYRTQRLPRYISVWGLIGVALMALLNVLAVPMSVGLVMALPIITNEIYMGIWLIVKELRPAALTSGSDTAA